MNYHKYLLLLYFEKRKLSCTYGIFKVSLSFRGNSVITKIILVFKLQLRIKEQNVLKFREFY